MEKSGEVKDLDYSVGGRYFPYWAAPLSPYVLEVIRHKNPNASGCQRGIPVISLHWFSIHIIIINVHNSLKTCEVSKLQWINVIDYGLNKPRHLSQAQNMVYGILFIRKPFEQIMFHLSKNWLRLFSLQHLTLTLDTLI